MRQASCLISLGVLAALVAGGCAAPKPAAPPPRPYLLHLPGIAGPRWIDQTLVAGLADGGVDAQIDTYDWTNGNPGLTALRAREHNMGQARLIAARLTAKYRADPRQVIHITAHSGGAGIAVWAMENLPEDVQVQTVILLAPALSPQYDLSRALSRVRGHMYAMSSRNDGIVLGTGTRLFGTIDGVKCDAAGRVGFAMPAGADAAQYAKLEPRPYDPDWAQLYGHNGDHIAPMGRAFARQYLAALLNGQASAAAQPTSRPLRLSLLSK